MISNWLFNSDLIAEYFSADQLGYWLVAHGISSVVIALLVWLLLPNKYRFPAYLSYTFLLSFALLMPVVGTLGLLLCVLPSLRFPKQRNRRVLDVLEQLTLPYAQLEKKESVLFNDGGLQDVLILQDDEAQRLNALLSIRNMKRLDAIPILKKTLRDPADDIRLLAYAMLDKYETQINTDLGNVQAQLEDAEGAHKTELHKQLALNYWELAYLGLAQGAVLEHVLEQALDNIQQAMVFKPVPELTLLQGRIALQQKRIDSAIMAFEQALALGMHKQHVLPYLAEAIYAAGRYQEIPEMLAQLPEALRNRYPFYDIVNYWHANANRS